MPNKLRGLLVGLGVLAVLTVGVFFALGLRSLPGDGLSQPRGAQPGA